MNLEILKRATHAALRCDGWTERQIENEHCHVSTLSYSLTEAIAEAVLREAIEACAEITYSSRTPKEIERKIRALLVQEKSR